MARILFIDDDPATLETLSKAVQVFGHQPIWASSGAEGLETALTHGPDLIFVDLRLPDMDGLDLVRALRAQSEIGHIPVLVLSADPALEAAQDAAAAGATAFVSKPVRLQALMDIIQDHTASAEL